MIGERLRAKSKPKEGEGGKIYLLKEHIREIVKLAVELKNFIEKNKSAIKYNFGRDFFKNLIVACFLHDLGKINLAFQKEVYSKEEKSGEEFKEVLRFFEGYGDIDLKDHEVVSILYSLIFLENDEWSKKIRTAILYHHYNDFYVNRQPHIAHIFQNYPALEKYLEFLLAKKEEIKELLEFLIEEVKKDSLDDLVKETLDELKSKIKYDALERLKENLDKGNSLSKVVKLFEITDKESEEFYEFCVFLGALRRCDYAASADVDVEFTENLYDNVYTNLESEIEMKINGYFWQKEILRKYAPNNTPNNMILVAPTGSGKTEFALLWARSMRKKMIYTLPLRVALNDLYWRFAGSKAGYFNKDFLRILHSTSFIEYLKEDSKGQELNIDEKIATSQLFSSPLLLTTPDQVFLSCLKFYGFDKLINIYPLSAIILDEIQTYTPEMAAIIIKTLEIVQKLDGNILIMTATLPSYFAEFLNEKNGFLIVDLKGENMKNNVKNYLTKRHKISLLETSLFNYEKDGTQSTLELNDDGLNQIKNIIKENKEKNILVIVNNVGKAIELYKTLENDCSSLFVEKENLYLLHSRLIEKEKSKRINEIKKKLEEIRNEVMNKNKRIVLVATQIVEASVDVDFDVLITEISPIDSQIQRWGRIYRNRRTEDYSERSPNVFVFTNTDRGTTTIYDKRVVAKTIDILRNYQNRTLDYETEREMIEEVFNSKMDENETLKDIFVKEINDNLEWLGYVSLEKRSEAQRTFRRIAGVQIVVPELIKESEDDIEKSFGEVIEKILEKNESNVSWEDMKKAVEEKIGKNIDKHKLREILYNYSVNIPLFCFKTVDSPFLKNWLKGFLILRAREIIINNGDQKEKLQEILKYGINNLAAIREDIDELEIKEFGEFEDES
jgi:CRISPR-associated endonuclease/helicase Cas3